MEAVVEILSGPRHPKCAASSGKHARVIRVEAQGIPGEREGLSAMRLGVTIHQSVAALRVTPGGHRHGQCIVGFQLERLVK